MTAPTTRLVVVGIALVAMSMGLVGAPSHALDTPAPEDANANGLIAFHRDGDIYVVAPPDGEPRLLAGGPVEDEARTWSPDGRRLLFVRVSEGGQTMMDQGGSVVVPTRARSFPILKENWPVTGEPGSEATGGQSRHAP